MLSKKLALILSSNNNLLASSIAELLTINKTFDDVVIENFTEVLTNCANFSGNFDLIVFLVGHSISTYFPKVAGLSGPGTKLLLVFGENEKFAIRFLSLLGADAIVSVESNFQELMTAVNTIVVKKLKYISPLLISSLTKHHDGNPLSKLSRKEFDVAMSLTEGRKGIEIASSLNISRKTVNTYMSRIYKKLSVTNDIQLARLVMMLESNQPR